MSPGPRTAGLSADEVRDEGVDVTFMIWLASRALSDLVDDALSSTDLNGDEFAVYSVLDASGSVTPTELARWMAAAPTTVSSYVKRFERRGHVAREPHPTDRRSYRIRLTPAGRRAHRAAAKRFLPVRGQVEAALGARLEEVHEALLAARAALDEVRRGT